MILLLFATVATVLLPLMPPLPPLLPLLLSSCQLHATFNRKPAESNSKKEIKMNVQSRLLGGCFECATWGRGREKSGWTPPATEFVSFFFLPFFSLQSIQPPKLSQIQIIHMSSTRHSERKTNLRHPTSYRGFLWIISDSANKLYRVIEMLYLKDQIIISRVIVLSGYYLLLRFFKKYESRKSNLILPTRYLYGGF